VTGRCISLSLFCICLRQCDKPIAMCVCPGTKVQWYREVQKSWYRVWTTDLSKT